MRRRSYGDSWLDGRLFNKPKDLKIGAFRLLALVGCPNDPDAALARYQGRTTAKKNLVVAEIDGIKHVCLPIRVRLEHEIRRSMTPEFLGKVLVKVLGEQVLKELFYDIWIEFHNAYARKEVRRDLARHRALCPQANAYRNMGVRTAASIYGNL